MIARRIERRCSTPIVHCCTVASQHARGSACVRMHLRACVCVAVHLPGWITHPKRGARHCTAALGELAPPEGYSTSTHLGFLSCAPSLRVRLRRDRDASARANTETDATLANARADHRRAGRCAVGYELPRALSSPALRTMGVPLLRPRVPHCVPWGAPFATSSTACVTWGAPFTTSSPALSTMGFPFCDLESRIEHCSDSDRCADSCRCADRCAAQPHRFWSLSCNSLVRAVIRRHTQAPHTRTHAPGPPKLTHMH
jgi:hypothetical protein